MRANIVDDPNFGGVVTLFVIEPKDITAGSTSGTTAQVISLTVLKPGDIVLPHGIRIDLSSPATHVDTCVASLGVTADATRFIGSADLKTSNLKARIVSDPTKLLPYVNQTGSDRTLSLTVTVGSDTVATIGIGELWVVVPILRYADRLPHRVG